MNNMQYTTQNNLLLDTLMKFYNKDGNLSKILSIINGHALESLRLIDWFVTNYAKKNFVGYDLVDKHGRTKRFKVYIDYKLKLKAYSKRRFDPFCRWERITIPYDDDNYMETTIGQLNFFKWAIEHEIIDYITKNYNEIEKDMNERNSISKKKNGTADSNESVELTIINDHGKTRKKREELSISACKCIKKENVKIVVSFN